MRMDSNRNIVEMTILPKAICRFGAFKIPMAFFMKLEQIILKLYGNTKDPK